MAGPTAMQNRYPGPPRRRVLLVEDHPDGRETLQLLLESWGYQVEVAEDGLDGLSKALSWKPDVALVDIGLPLLDGYGFARRVRAALRDSIVLVALTAYAQPDDRRRAMQAGFDVHMAKPADFEELGRVLSQPARFTGASSAPASGAP